MKRGDGDPEPVRCFIVGFPRSGTTYLQGLLATSPDVVSFPETHAFPSMYRGPFKRIGIGKRKPIARFAAPSVAGGEPGSGLHPLTLRRRIDDFIRTLDEIAAERGAKAWVEKTPRHLHYIPVIEKYVPGSRFIHVVREGKDAVASYYKVCRDYPDVWGGAKSVRTCIERWNRDLRTSLSYLSSRRHSFVDFEALVRNPVGECGRLLREIGLPGSSIRADILPEVVGGLIQEYETWKKRDRRDAPPPTDEDSENEDFFSEFGTALEGLDRAMHEKIRERVSFD